MFSGGVPFGAAASEFFGGPCTNGVAFLSQQRFYFVASLGNKQQIRTEFSNSTSSFGFKGVSLC